MEAMNFILYAKQKRQIEGAGWGVCPQRNQKLGKQNCKEIWDIYVRGNIKSIH